MWVVPLFDERNLYVCWRQQGRVVHRELKSHEEEAYLASSNKEQELYGIISRNLF